MTCNEVRELQSNYLDEELIDVVRAKVDQHLAHCPACAADYVAVASAVTRLREEARRDSAGPWFADRVLDRLARENDTTNTPLDVDDPSQMTFSEL
ncbi:MAG TPA: zf-HC2 domain-containing protein [Capsulimonadaceae bacterium]|jgi:predicted anti-sigma-YlaC factor YlaD